MAKPPCDICGTRHESYQAHVFTGPRVVIPGAGVMPINTPAINAAPINGRSPNGRKREDYNAYMRDYMRARRARVPS